MAVIGRSQEPYWAWACKTCKRQLRDSLSRCCGDYGMTIYLVPEDLHRGAVEERDALLERAASLIAQPAITDEARCAWYADVDRLLGGQ
jgi:hypothetical protein